MRKKQFLLIISLVVIIFAIILFVGIKGCIRSHFSKDPYINLYLTEEKTVIKMNLETYLIGCVAAEMPANFELEALKAQAVCARTYALCKLIDNHPYPKKANLSDDILSCQAYVSVEDFYKRHPQKPEILLSKVKKAVKETEGIVMLYNGQPIDALYHSTCGGRTASAEEVWGNKVPYLISKKCSYCVDSKHYLSTQTFPFADINQALATKITFNSSIKISQKSSSGRTLEINLGDTKISSLKLRQALKLPSNWVSLKSDARGVTISCRGYGHGVGMCQYGANGLALKGEAYKGILNHYYHNIDIYKINY